MLRKYLAFFVVALLMINIGCQPKSSSDDIGHGTSVPVPAAFEKVEQTCLRRLKERMKKGDFSFSEVSNPQMNTEVKTITAAPWVSATDVAYSLSHNLKNDLVTLVEVDRSKKDGDIAVKYGVNLTLPDKDADYLFTLNLNYSSESVSGVNTTLTQRLRVNSNCQLVLTETNFTKTTLANSKISGLHLQEFADAKAGSFRATQSEADVPIGASFTNSSSGNDKVDWEGLRTLLSSQPKDTFYYSRTQTAPYIMKFNLDVGADIYHFDPILGKQTQFHQLIMHIESMGDYQVGYSLNSDFKFSRFGNGDESWTVNPALFESAKLSRAESNLARSFEITPELFHRNQPVRAEFLISRELKYPNLKSYWSIESKEPISASTDGFKFKYILQSQKITAQDQDSAKLVTGPKEKALNPDLQERANLQISIAPVQAMILKLQRKGPLNRLQMARLVGKLVGETLTYDYASLKESTIHALTTSEILERKIGVCQHYANLFATLARGVGIPTRFITGFYLSPNGVGAHAWNEIEIRPGIWVPIEPQNPSLNLNPMFYFPIVSGGYMETMKDDDGFQAGIAMMLEFHAKALEVVPGPKQ